MGREQEVNCQILRAEEEEKIENEEPLVCFRCDGSKVNKKGLPCRRCNGSGVLDSQFFVEMRKIFSEEIKNYTAQTF